MLTHTLSVSVLTLFIPKSNNILFFQKPFRVKVNSHKKNIEEETTIHNRELHK